MPEDSSPRAAARRADSAEQRLTVRQRLAVALSSELTTEDWKDIVKAAKKNGRHADLARYLDHAFGKVQHEADPDPDPSASLAEMTPAQRASHRDVVMRELAAMEDAALEQATQLRPLEAMHPVDAPPPIAP